MGSTSTRRIGAIVGTVSLAALGLVGLGAGPAAADPVSFTYTGGNQTYVVPTDGSVCSVRLEAAGANGGLGDFPEGTVEGAASGGGGRVGAASVGGTGGTAVATFPVLPGDHISVVVGGSGGAGADQSQAGGFGGGGNGGNGSTPGAGDILRGGGGGGLSGFFLSGSPLLVAGGGGGGGAYNADGGNGGSAANEGSPGQDVSSHPDFGQRGTGGFVNAGGIGGTAGVPVTGNTPGGNGASLQGGTGGDGATTFGAGGGGGGGGGYFGGGGGGGASTDGSGGGGGGGSSFVAASGTGTGTGTLTQDQAGNGAAQVTPVEGCRILTVAKTVQGVVPAGTQFTADVTCTTGETAQVRFDSTGKALTENRVAVAAAGSCLVSETSTGGATGTAYTCTDNHTTATAFCQTGGQRVTFGRDPGQAATVTVTNTFPAAAPAAVVVTPRFTG
jgi:hypothetical protein